MKTITVSNGDIQLNNGKIQFSTGSQKLVEDLTRWLEEPLGTGYTTPGFGSLLWNSIGQGQTIASTSIVQSEISRVLQLYQSQQIYSLQQSQNSSQLSNWNKSEIIQNITSINTVVNQTSIVATVTIQTLQDSSITLNFSIDQNGVSIQNG
jgi:hypothetical protein